MAMTVRVGVLLVWMPLSALAIEPGPSSRYQQETENWLQVQVSGKEGSTVPQTLTPQEREQSLQRLLKSYDHEIPEYYKQESGGGAGRPINARATACAR
ncbi:hypothetical protein AA042_13305 [Pseudomonas lundensis]|nr:hypothetical protein AA042_13305 [Pseudomonas lundensis]